MSEVLGRASEDFMKPVVRRFTLDAFMPQQPGFDRGCGVGELVGRNRMILLERPCQRTRDNGCQFGILEQRGERKKMRQ
jgi:hypothetical protein